MSVRQPPGRSATLADLRSVLDPAIPTFLLVDPMLGDPFHAGDLPGEPIAVGKSRATHWLRSVTAIPLHPSVPLPANQHPYLVELQGPHDPWLLQSLDAAHSELQASQSGGFDGTGAAPHRIGGWLQTSVYADQLAVTLAALHRIPAAVFTSDTYFRIADRRVFSLLRYAVGDSRVARTFGPLKSWTCLDARGQLTTVARPSSDPTNAPDRLTLSSEEWAVLSGAEAVNRAMAMALGAAPQVESDTSRLATMDLYAAAFNAVAHARSARVQWPRRFTDPGDETLWAALCLLCPPLRTVPSGVASLDEWMARIEAAEPVRFVYPEIVAMLQEASPRLSNSSLQA